ncbi:MAG: hypothetical protein M1832_005658 [Thelocarpon impressellum]|nr:MAG: hypothetical protein M1832_005658 [Thelocarpon impressellum]
MFPRQFGLHNVFTSTVDTRETVQPFKDYTLREREILQQGQLNKLKGGASLRSSKNKLPRRLRGTTAPERYNFPFDQTRSNPDSQEQDLRGERDQSLLDVATPSSQVSAFSRAVLAAVIPDGFWGAGEVARGNKEAMMCHVDRFIKLRRYESLSLHAVLQGFKITSLSWLMPENHDSGARLARTDVLKRWEIFSEFIYYLFDSFLIPLIRSNFHVTESSVHRNRLFYFRHDIWRTVSEAAFEGLRTSMFDEIDSVRAKRVLEKRPLGFSQVRLLPKVSGVRAIMNLRRRTARQQNGKAILGRSINSIMAPVYNMLSYEKVSQPVRLGSALFSVGDMYARLKSFRAKLQDAGLLGARLHFVKVDVQSCFDTIPQRRVMKLIEDLVSEDEYRIERHVEIKAPNVRQHGPMSGPGARPARKFVASARASDDFSTFRQKVEGELAHGKRNAVFVDQVLQTFRQKEDLLDLLQEHIERNIVKVGRTFYRQTSGIPQGSVVSSLLCNFFYADFERTCLGFLDQGESLLLRLIDDFLLITTNQEHAGQFLQVMHSGNPEYGMSVSRSKSLVNFDARVGGVKIGKMEAGTRFPYCGNLIDTGTLEISKDRGRGGRFEMSDSLTVESSKVPGRTFHRKALKYVARIGRFFHISRRHDGNTAPLDSAAAIAFKIQTHAMFLDTNFNSTATVLSNLYQIFAESAMKFYRYAKCMPPRKQPQTRLLIRTIHDMIDLAFVLMKSKGKHGQNGHFRCAVSKAQVKWLGCTAFQVALHRKQSRFGEVLAWLEQAISGTLPRSGTKTIELRAETQRLRKAACAGQEAFGRARY